MKKLLNPNSNNIKRYIDKYRHTENYVLADKAILKLIKLYPNNNNLKEILIKVTTINQLYSTRIWDVISVAQKIYKCKIDKDINDGNIKVVKKIINVNNRNFYSFATKYCHFHNNKAFPMYDNYVEYILFEYQKQYKFNKFYKQDLKDYEIFFEVINNFIDYFKLNNFSYKYIDKFLWLYGREVKNKNI